MYDATQIRRGKGKFEPYAILLSRNRQSRPVSTPVALIAMLPDLAAFVHHRLRICVEAREVNDGSRSQSTVTLRSILNWKTLCIFNLHDSALHHLSISKSKSKKQNVLALRCEVEL